MSGAATEMQLRLFSKSVAKQAKWRAIERLLPDESNIRGLDLGADNGTISYLLRERGGHWSSADIADEAVSAIRNVVGEQVFATDGRTLPFDNNAFDVVVVIDMLEHVHDDRQLVTELHRVLRPGGRLIVNVPHHKRVSLLRPLRLAVGLTDEWHGHVRPGYRRETLAELLGPGFQITCAHTYNRAFSEFLDILLNAAYLRKNRTSAGSSKGTIVTADDLDRQARTFQLYSRLYPLLRAFASLDVLVAPLSGYSLIVAAQKRGPDHPAT